jgi:diguanylate cyclase (GGDEF)-like protein
MRSIAFVSLLVGVVLIPTALGIAKLEHDRDASRLERTLRAEADQQAGVLAAYFERARANILLTANVPAFSNVLAEDGTRVAKVRRQGRSLREVTRQLGYLEELYPDSIGEACLIDHRGEEYARVVRGDVARPGDLSTVEEQTTFFAPTFALSAGKVHQTRPYVSPDTREWVVANATPIPGSGHGDRAIVHFEVTVESFRQAMSSNRDAELRVVDAFTGAVVIDGAHPQRVGARLGVARDKRFAGLVSDARRSGVTDMDGRRTAFHRIVGGPDNANRWMVVATAPTATGGFLSRLGVASIALLVIAFLVSGLAAVALRAGRRELEVQATTDALTGLGNRRKLLADLERCVRTARADEPVVLVMFDLNGFKTYNDNFGHPAGDALLTRLGDALQEALRPFGGRAYRPGGDEFCVIANTSRRHALEEAACAALSMTGQGFAISSAFGSVVIPQETGDGGEALRKADRAMYAQKHLGRTSAGRQSSDVLRRALAERHPQLGEHIHGVVELAGQVAERLGIEGEELAQICDAAALHDIGKVAIPDAIISKPGPLDEDEWAFMRRHTLIGERIIAAAPALGGAARLVRASHEAWDGSGYPDRVKGVEVPLGARVIAVCDAFDAMISDRPYARAMTVEQALAELRRCAGTQFDPAIVREFERVMAERAAAPTVRGA